MEYYTNMGDVEHHIKKENQLSQQIGSWCWSHQKGLTSELKLNLTLYLRKENNIINYNKSVALV